jgi:FKBP-type peptidyl-prolyl cis-trans isomerase 2
MVVGKHTVVTMQYVVRDEEGNVLNDLYEHTPVKFTFGFGNLPPGLEEKLPGLHSGERGIIIIPPEEGYGKRIKEKIIRVRREDLPDDGECVVGNKFRLFYSCQETELFTVQGYLGEWVYLDRNHPYAGKTLHYEVYIVDVSPV